MAKPTSFANPQLFDARATTKLLESSARKTAATGPARNEVDANYKKREATWKKKLEGADDTMREAAKKERKAGQLKRKWQAHEQQHKEYEQFFTEHMGVVAFETQLKTAAVHSAVDCGIRASTSKCCKRKSRAWQRSKKRCRSSRWMQS
jgi:hypothetical protein